MFTPEQRELIDKLKKFGYGWKKFAISVEKSGVCSIKQEQTMQDMLAKVSQQSILVRYRKNNKRTCRKNNKPTSNNDWGDDHGNSDHEAMRSGDYF